MSKIAKQVLIVHHIIKSPQTRVLLIFLSISVTNPVLRKRKTPLRNTQSDLTPKDKRPISEEFTKTVIDPKYAISSAMEDACNIWPPG
jgi:hypothetical protein